MCETKVELPRPPTEVILDMASLKEGLISFCIRIFLKDTIFSLVKEKTNATLSECVTLMTDEVEPSCVSQFLLIK